MDNEVDWMKLENRIRATPIDLLRQGILRKQWGAVELCYTMLTGQVVQVSSEVKQFSIEDVKNLKPLSDIPPYHDAKELQTPVVKRGRGRPKKVPPTPFADIPALPSGAMILPNISASAPSMPTQSTTYGVPSDCVSTTKQKSVNGKIRNFGNFQPHDLSPHPNKFKDDLTIAPSEAIKDRVVPAEILEAARPPVHNIKIKCSTCGKLDDIDPSLAPHGYRLTKNYTMRYQCNSCIVGARSGMEMDASATDDDLLPDEE